MTWSPRPTLADRRTLLDTLVRAALAGQTRLVTGPAGIGKSYLLSHVAEVVRRERPVHELIATRAAASMPLGVYLPVVDRVETAFEAATRLRLTLVESRPFVTVDDAHLLDPASAALLLELARGGVPLLLSVGEGCPVDATIATLERLCAAPRISIPPLTESETARIIASRLGSIADPGLVATVRHRSSGIPLFVDEMLQALVDSHRIGYESGTAYVIGGVRSFPAMGVKEQGERLSPDALRVVRLVALARALPECMARALVPSAAVEEAEAAGFISVLTRERTVVLEPRHPWLADSVTASMHTSVRLTLLEQLVDALPPATADALLSARALEWRIELGHVVAVDELLEGAARVQVVAPAEADRLLDCAIDRATSPEHRLQLATMLAHRHRVTDAETLLADLAADNLPAQLGRWRDIVHSFVLFFPANDPARAITLLRSHTDDDDPHLLAHLATALMQLGDIPAAIRVGTPVMEDPAAPALARAHAALTVSSALVHAGRIDEYDAVRKQRSLLISDAEAELPVGAESASLIDASALLEVREALDAAETIARAAYERSLARDDEGMRAQHSHQLARIALERGAPNDALPHAIGAVVADGLWALAFRAWTSATLIEALVLSGRTAEAAAHRDRALSRPRSPLYDIDIARAVAVVAAANGDTEGAADQLTKAALQALARGQSTGGRHALDQAVRYGSDAAARALLRIRRVPAGDALARSQALARGWLGRDSEALEAAARDLRSHGLLWRAIETAALAGRAGGRDDSAVLAGLRVRCPSLKSPVVPPAPLTVLTAREADFARRAAAGQSDAEIAGDTGLSIRTVQTHLSNIYHKLGIRSRAELAARLGDGSVLRSAAGT